MPEENVTIETVIDYNTYIMLTSTAARSYVYAYDSDMYTIKTFVTKKNNSYVTIELGKNGKFVFVRIA